MLAFSLVGPFRHFSPSRPRQCHHPKSLLCSPQRANGDEQRIFTRLFALLIMIECLGYHLVEVDLGTVRTESLSSEDQSPATTQSTRYPCSQTQLVRWLGTAAVVAQRPELAPSSPLGPQRLLGWGETAPHPPEN